MTRRQFHVTYDVVTPESAEHGDTADNGFIDPRGNLESVAEICGSAVTPIKDACAMTLREALLLVSPQEDSGHWFSEVDGRDNYRTGANEVRSLHPPETITDSSYGRLSRLLGV